MDQQFLALPRLHIMTFSITVTTIFFLFYYASEQIKDINDK